MDQEPSAEFKAGQDDARWKIKFRLLREACQEDAANAALICRLAQRSCGFPDDPDEGKSFADVVRENKELYKRYLDLLERIKFLEHDTHLLTERIGVKFENTWKRELVETPKT